MNPMVLLDSSEDELCEAKGWVETTVDVAAARVLLEPYCFDDMDKPARPQGEPRRVWLCIAESYSSDEERWMPCEPTDKGAREFYEFDATDCEAA